MRFVLIALLLIYNLATFAQEDLMDLMDEELAEVPKTEYVQSTFKATRIVNSRTVELPAKGVLNFVIQHRFGRMDSDWRRFFGIDDAHMRLGLDYGLFDWMSLGLARSSEQGMFDLFIKLKFLCQSTGKRKIPISAVWLSNMGIISKTMPEGADRVHRLSYVHQLLIARKFNRVFSMQIMPTYIHLNLDQVPQEEMIFNPVTNLEDSVTNIYRNNIYAVGVGFRVLVSRSISINAEYTQPFHAGMFKEDRIPVGSLALGLDIETGGHVFQITFTNTMSQTEQQFIPDNAGYWWDREFYIGFNINRVITIVNYEKRAAKKNKNKEQW